AGCWSIQTSNAVFKWCRELKCNRERSQVTRAGRQEYSWRPFFVVIERR
ncbi:MAG: hypothetical protein ACI814_001865, partial [Mariniblastus sp.]